MKKQVVVSRYREDLSWSFNFDIDTIVYDKYDVINVANYVFEPRVTTDMSRICHSDYVSKTTSSFQVRFDQKLRPTIHVRQTDAPKLERNDLKVVSIPNDRRGREAHTYLFHIWNNYEDLAETTFFLQGNPFVHCPDVLDLFHCDYTRPTSLTAFYKKNAIPNDDLTEFVCDKEVRYGLATRHPHYRKLHAAWMEVFPNVKMPDPVYFGYGAMWAVPRKTLQARSRRFWRQMLESVSRIDGWVFEMLWMYIFSDPVDYPDFTNWIDYTYPLF